MSESEFSAFFSAYWKDAFRLAYSYLRSEADSENVVQESFLYYWQKDPKKKNPKAYLMGVVAHKALDELRHRIRAGELPLDEECAGANEQGSDPDVERLYGALRKLKPKYSEVLRLRYFAGLTDQEIALAIGASVASAEKRIERAKKMLKEGMEDERTSI